MSEIESKYKNMKTYHDLVEEGDGGSHIMDQVLAQKAKIKKNLSGIKHIIAVGSGKGGVGKSTLSIQLAISLQKSGKRVALLDADFNGPSQARLAGLMDVVFIPGKDGFDIPGTPSGLKVLSFGSLIPESETLEFSNVSQGDSHIWRATKEFSTLSEILGSANWGQLDYLLVDLPPGADRCYQYAQFLGSDVRFILVTIPSELAKGVVNRSLTALHKANAKVLGYIENMAGYYCHDCKELKPLFPEGSPPEWGIDLLGKVPFDAEVALNCDKGTLESQFTELSSAEPFREIIKKLNNLLE